MRLTGGELLYHGSYMLVEEPLLEKCAPRKDFGRGFYLTTSLEQARSFAALSLRKARANGAVCAATASSISSTSSTTGFVSRFRFEPSSTSPLTTFAFESADAEWLHCVVAHRKESLFDDVLAGMACYDVISGKIANDQTNATIVAYIGGIFGTPGDAAADETCIRLLIPERLHDQHCFKTEKALSALTFEGGERV